MKTQIAKRSHVLFIIISILLTACLLTVNISFAGPVRGRVSTNRHVIIPGTVVAKLPARHHSIQVRGAHYFFANGIFYKKGPSGFIVITAPFGAIITALPVGYTTVIVNDSDEYFVYEGVYYRKIPAGYVVVETPAEVIVTETPAPEPASQVTSTDKVIVTASALNLRTGPGLQHPAVGQVRKGNTLKVIGNAPGWLYVQLPSGKFGWVMEQLTARISTPPPASG